VAACVITGDVGGATAATGRQDLLPSMFGITDASYGFLARPCGIEWHIMCSPFPHERPVRGTVPWVGDKINTCTERRHRT
jgi:hypothetical protein